MRLAEILGCCQEDSKKLPWLVRFEFKRIDARFVGTFRFLVACAIPIDTPRFASSRKWNERRKRR
ncbi:hypothetical protein RBSWK_04246 [Rhodopirellula baltica SWK14]|uniref:Uncharacterized protein n=1 Tax=Rhodopirellula baltica SWK14 TaxID=993516 RepID=L7CD04_RHOBT|nr:hypothetical protein RBSWK_04246 [Rhodopirellula baltica SWK14]